MQGLLKLIELRKWMERNNRSEAEGRQYLLSFGCNRDDITPLSIIIKIYGNMRQRYDTEAHKNEEKPIKKVWFQFRQQ